MINQSKDILYLNKITIIYKINKNNKIRLFGKKFVENNKENYKIIINNIEQDLCEELYIEEKDRNMKTIDIQLKVLKPINNISHIFEDCVTLLSLPNISELDTTNITNMSYMFCNCLSLSTLSDISKWNTQNVTNMCSMFLKCSSLNTLPDISKWNTKNVKYMNFMFSGCSSLLYLPDISKWNINNVDYMNSMFSGCLSLFLLPDFSNWFKNNNKNIHIFHECINNLSLVE